MLRYQQTERLIWEIEGWVYFAFTIQNGQVGVFFCPVIPEGISIETIVLPVLFIQFTASAKIPRSGRVIPWPESPSISMVLGKISGATNTLSISMMCFACMALSEVSFLYNRLIIFRYEVEFLHRVLQSIIFCKRQCISAVVARTCHNENRLVTMKCESILFEKCKSSPFH